MNPQRTRTPHIVLRISLGLIFILFAAYQVHAGLWGRIPAYFRVQPTWYAGFNLAVMVLVAVLSWGAVIFAALTRWQWKWPLFILFIASIVACEAYQRAAGHPMGYTDWLIIWQGRANTGDAIHQYADVIKQAAVTLVPLLYGFVIMPHIRWRVWPLAVVSLIASVGLFVVTAVMTQGAGTQWLPSPTKLYGMAASTLLDGASSQHYRYTTQTQPSAAPEAAHIALVIDESVRDDFFNHIVIPEIKSQHSDWHIYDFGTATSMANCSATSNIMLRKTVRENHISRDLYHHALIWSLAHNAGLSTTLADAQHHGIGHDHFDATERSLIDHIPPVAQGNDKKLVSRLRHNWAGVPSFSIVIKSGPHFPYSDKYPSGYHSRSPAMSVPYVARSAMRRHYVNAIDYQTGGFFKALLKTNPSAKTIVIYTSDHGQYLAGHGTLTHCNIKSWVHVGEGTVPLVVLSNFPIPGMRQAAHRNAGRLSQFDMVYSLRRALGYTRNARTDRGFLRTGGKPAAGFVWGVPFGQFNSRVHIKLVDRSAYKRLEHKRWKPAPERSP